MLSSLEPTYSVYFQGKVRSRHDDEGFTEAFHVMIDFSFSCSRS